MMGLAKANPRYGYRHYSLVRGKGGGTRCDDSNRATGRSRRMGNLRYRYLGLGGRKRNQRVSFVHKGDLIRRDTASD